MAAYAARLQVSEVVDYCASSDEPPVGSPRSRRQQRQRVSAPRAQSVHAFHCRARLPPPVRCREAAVRRGLVSITRALPLARVTAMLAAVTSIPHSFRGGPRFSPIRNSMFSRRRFRYNFPKICVSHNWMYAAKKTKPARMQEEEELDFAARPVRSTVQHRLSNRPGAIRMWRLRDRRQRGFRVRQIEVCDNDIKALIAHGLLDRLQRDDAGAVERAIGSLLDRLSR